MANVLIVDDETSIRVTLAAFLAGEGHIVRIAEDAQTALNKLAKKTVDVVVTDIIMPKITGVDLLKRIRQIAPHVQVILMTGEPEVETAAEAMRAGALDYLVKPVSKEAITRSVTNAVRVKSLEDDRGRLMKKNKQYRRELETALAQQTQARHKTEMKYRELVENANSIILRRAVDGAITFFNEYAQSFFGYTEDEVIGRNVVGTIIPAIDASGQDLAAMVADISRHPDNYVTNENENIKRNGERAWIAWANKAIRDKNGRVVEMLCVGNDITERKRLEDQLREAQKLEAIGQLAGGVAHDFNNVLTAIQGFGSLAHSDLPEDSPVRREIEEVLKAADRAAVLVRQLMALSCKQAQQPKVVDLGAILSDLEKMLRRVIRADIEMKITTGSVGNRVKADPGQIEQVVMNLAVNARDAMPNGGTLSIDIENIKVDGNRRLHPADITPESYVLLSVSDNGTGMDKETLSHLFEPFFTTKEKGKGTGLGLATVYGIIKQNQGWIDVESTPGRGSTFRIYLPCVDANPEIAPNAEKKLGSSNGETLLVVEDDDDVLKATATLLRAKGYSVLTAANGEEALGKAREYPGDIPLILTDLIMPGCNGSQVARKIKRFRPQIQVLYMSGYRDGEVISSCDLPHKSGLIQKPYTATELTDKVQSTLKNRKLRMGMGSNDPDNEEHEKESSLP